MLGLFFYEFVLAQYAYWSQRGYYPDDPFKANQDDFGVIASFAGREKDCWLAVYDGHGKRGQDCSAYAKKHLPRLAAKYIRQARVKKYQTKLKKEGKLKDGAKVFDPTMWPILDPEEYKACCRRAFLECNKDMQESNDVSALQE